jgi:hypothetical protein
LCWANWITIHKKTQTRTLLPCAKINSKWIKDLHVRPDTLKPREENIGEIFQDIGKGNNFVDRTSITQKRKARIDKGDYIKS